jgi:hypothetical protein
MDVDEMEAGRELNALIAELVFQTDLKTKCDNFKAGRCDGERYVRCGACGKGGHGNCYGYNYGEGAVQIACADNCQAPDYSGDISAAWEVVEALENCFVELTYCGKNEAGYECGVTILTNGEHFACANTLPLAICRAALKAVSASEVGSVRSTISALSPVSIPPC